MDSETSAEIDNLKVHNFEMTALNLVLSARINALMDMVRFIAVKQKVNLHPKSNFPTFLSRLEERKLDALLKMYADHHPAMATAMKQWIEQSLP